MDFDGPFAGRPRGPALDLWFIDLALEPSAEEQSLLSPDEVARAERLIIPSKARQLVRARAALRQILGEVAGQYPASLRFVYGEHGKPELEGAAKLAFNLSHSPEVGLLGVVRMDIPLGVDIEHGREGRAFSSIAEHFFADPEASWLERRGVEARDFYRMWTHKEAYLKALATGLSFSSRGFCMDLECAPARLSSTQWPGERPWSFADLPCPAGYAAAVCWSGPELELRTHVAPGSTAEAFR